MYEHSGTRFRLYPHLPATRGATSETVWVSPMAGTVGPGPSDDRLYAVNPVGKRRAYGFYPARGGSVRHYRPPWTGPEHPPPEPDEMGHFDYLDYGMPGFTVAHAFGCIRFTLDIWEDYFGGQIPFHFAADYHRLEIVLLEGLDNAFAGYGSIELGSYFRENGEQMDFGLSFDVIAHELGHLIIYSTVGLPDTSDLDGEQFGFHESAADMVSLIALMHFESAAEDILAKSRGNLYSFNALNRFAEVSDFEQLRLVSNSATLWEFEQGWESEHDLSQPLTAALFDIWIDVFHENLLAAGVMTGALEDLSDRLEDNPEYHTILQPLFDESYAAAPAEFAAALAGARDYMGDVLALTWSRMPNVPEYARFMKYMRDADEALTEGRFRRIIDANMTRRGIGVTTAGPRRRAPDKDSHAFSARTFVPDKTPLRSRPCMPYSTRFRLAHGG